MFKDGMLLLQGGDALPELRLLWEMYEHGHNTHQHPLMQKRKHQRQVLPQ
jgi:hypothetical protein